MQNLLGLFVLATWLPLNSIAEDVPKTVQAAAGQFSAIVSIVFVESSSHICSGMLVDLGHVVTSAFCVTERKPRDLEIFAGSGQLTEIVKVSLVISHPDYETGNYDYNIAVLRLLKSLTKSIHVHPAVLAMNKPEEKENCFVAGWSRDETKENLTMFYSRVSVMKIELCRKCAENTICAGNDVHDGDCINDLGSPLICNGVLYGIYVGSVKNCQTSSGLYSDIVFYKDWVETLVEWLGDGKIPLPSPATRKMYELV